MMMAKNQDIAAGALVIAGVMLRPLAMTVLIWALPLFFLLLTVSTVWMFAQMYRDTLLSRITKTAPNELGSDFYVRIATFGALPLLTWLAYQFPSVGGFVLRYIQPGLEVVK
jgi:hypothetical protein